MVLEFYLLCTYVLYQIYRWWCKYSTKVSFFWDPSQGISLSGFPPKNRPTYAAFWGKFMIITVIFGVNMNTKAPKNPGRKLEWRRSICADTVSIIYFGNYNPLGCSSIVHSAMWSINRIRNSCPDSDLRKNWLSILAFQF